MRKFILAVVFMLCFGSLFAAKFKIESVTYDIEGCGHWIFGKTQEFALANEVPVDTKTYFNDEEAFNKYLGDLETRLSNLRAFETILLSYEVFYTDSQTSGEEINFTKLNIYVKDSFHLFAIPGPKYSSNSGLTLKLKIKDSNFLGGLNTLNSDIFFVIPTNESDQNDTQFGFNCSADLPFKAGIFNAVWLNDLGLSFTLGDSMPEWQIGTGVRFTLPFEHISLVFEVNQRFENKNDYKVFKDNMFFTNDFKLSSPVTLGTIDYFGKLTWTPYAVTYVYWDFDGISNYNDSLASPVSTFGHRFSFGRTDWDQNLRTGFTLSLDNYYTYNFKLKKLDPVVLLDTTAYKKIDLIPDSYILPDMGIALNVVAFTYLFNPKSKDNIYSYGKGIGGYLRGIRDTQEYVGTKYSSLSPTTAFILNLDFPIHLFRTNFKKAFLNFDLQASPFIDIALCNNKITNTLFDPKDGFYAAGLEFLVYPLKWSGITIRGSIGIDVGRKFLSNYLNMDWRENVSKKEFLIGFGLQY